MTHTESPIRVCVLANSARYISNFRLNLMTTLRAQGYDVIAMSPYGKEVSSIKDAGFRHICLPLVPKGTQIWQEMKTIISLRRLLRKHLVRIVLTSTPKGNIYTALANFGTGRLQVANVSGLGSSYLRQDVISHVVSFFYFVTFRTIDYVFFENRSDHDKFLAHGWVRRRLASVIPGLGVDLVHFDAQPWPKRGGRAVRFLMIARLIGDKGIREYVTAAHKVRAVYRHAEFHVLGDSAADNPTCISPSELENWVFSGHIHHHEHTNDVRQFIADSHCIVLPSYREGMSRTLLEGGAMARPLIASDVPGCREAINHGHNGYLCQPQNAESLADVIIKFLSLDSENKRIMGIRSRDIVSKNFSEDIVLKKYSEVLKELFCAPEM